MTKKEVHDVQVKKKAVERPLSTPGDQVYSRQDLTVAITGNVAAVLRESVAVSAENVGRNRALAVLV